MAGSGGIRHDEARAQGTRLTYPASNAPIAQGGESVARTVPPRRRAVPPRRVVGVSADGRDFVGLWTMMIRATDRLLFGAEIWLTGVRRHY